MKLALKLTAGGIAAGLTTAGLVAATPAGAPVENVSCPSPVPSSSGKYIRMPSACSTSATSTRATALLFTVQTDPSQLPMAARLRVPTGRLTAAPAYKRNEP